MYSNSCKQAPKPCGIIAILTDFGLDDPYVAAMKAVALDICPRVNIVDITHNVRSFDIRYAALVLYMVFRYFPRGTVFVVVVDPGVGSNRRAIMIASSNYIFMGPDNGVLIPAAENDGVVDVRIIENEYYFRRPASKSFHGRDIFMPVAAHIVCRESLLNDIGRIIDLESLVRLDLGIGYMEAQGGCVQLKIVHIDKFGNLMLSVPFSQLRQKLNIDIGSKVYVYTDNKSVEARVEEVFSVTPKGTLVLYENSFGLAELAVNQGSARKVLNVDIDYTILICP